MQNIAKQTSMIIKMAPPITLGTSTFRGTELAFVLALVLVLLVLDVPFVLELKEF